MELVAPAAAAAATAVLLSVREFSNHGEERLCLCKPTVTDEDRYTNDVQHARSKCLYHTSIITPSFPT